MNKNETTGKKVGRIIGRVMATIGTTLAAIFIALYSMLWIFCHGPSKSARNLFVSTILETGALKFLAGWYFDKDEILEITSKNNMKLIPIMLIPILSIFLTKMMMIKIRMTKKKVLMKTVLR